MKLLSTVSALLVLLLSLNVSANANQELVKAYPGEENTRLIEFTDIKSAKVKKTFESVDLALEMGDGYYDVLKSAFYMVFTKDGKLAGFMEVALLSYTEDPDLYLVAAFVNSKGVRLGDVHQLNVFLGYDDGDIRSLPKELQP